MKNNFLMVDHIKSEGKNFDGEKGPGRVIATISNEINKEDLSNGYPSGETAKVLKKAGIDFHPGMDKESFPPLYGWIPAVIEKLEYSVEEITPEDKVFSGNACYSAAIQSKLESLDWRGAKNKVSEGVPVIVISRASKGSGEIGILTALGEMKEEKDFIVCTVNGFFKNYEIFNINHMDRPMYFCPKKKESLPQ